MSIEARVFERGDARGVHHCLLFMPAEASYGFASFVIHVDLNSLSLGKRRAKKKSEAVHRLWELADSKEAIIFLSDCLFVYLSGEERM